MVVSRFFRLRLILAIAAGVAFLRRRYRRKVLAIASEMRPLSFEALANFVDTTVGPSYTPNVLTKRGSPRGTIRNLVMRSENSRFYPGVARRRGWDRLFPPAQGLRRVPVRIFFGPKNWLPKGDFRISGPDTPEVSEPKPYRRQLRVYVPKDLDRTVPAAFLLVNDGITYENFASYVPWLRLFCNCFGFAGSIMDAVSIIGVVDMLVREGRIQPTVCIALEHGGAGAWGGQRGLEYDTVSGRFAEFVEAEVLPFVARECDITLTSDPNLRAVMGFSSGASAALSMAWFRTDLYRRVLAYSISTTSLQYPFNAATPLGAWDFHSGQELIKKGDFRRGLRVALYTMEYDFGFHLPESTYFNWSAASHRTAKALKESGYSCRHIFCRDAVHVDPRVVAQTLPEALEWLLSDQN